MTSSQDKWRSGLASEVDFWRKLIRGKIRNPEWIADLWGRLAGELDFPQHLRQYLPEGSARILDVGSGPATSLGPKKMPCSAEVIPIDPLAGTYDQLLGQAGLKCWNPTRPGEGERLSDLDLGLFDLVYSRNALDHTYDPLRVIREMVSVCKPHGTVYFEGHTNESVKQRAHGLHQWNFMPIDTGDLVVWQLDGMAASLRSALGEDFSVKAAGRDWYRVEVKRRA